jgi:VanZ family protein
VIFSACLFTIGSIPAAGLAFPGIMHWVAHTTAYAMIAFATSLGWEKWPVMRITAVVVAIGAIHETSEIITHNHGLEIKDIMVNTIGALLGVAFQRITKRVFLL